MQWYRDISDRITNSSWACGLKRTTTIEFTLEALGTEVNMRDWDQEQPLSFGRGHR